MDENFSLGVNKVGIFILAAIVVIIALLMHNYKFKAYLKKHHLLRVFVDTTLLMLLWYIGNEFMPWWISAIVAFVISYFIDRKAKTYS